MAIVSRGDHVGPLLDDAYDLTECGGDLLYIARLSAAYFLVWGDLRTRDFDFQITYSVEADVPQVLRFYSRRPPVDPRLPADWRPLRASAVDR